MFIAIFKNVVLFPNHLSQTPGSPLKEGDKRRGGGWRTGLNPHVVICYL